MTHPLTAKPVLVPIQPKAELIDFWSTDENHNRYLWAGALFHVWSNCCLKCTKLFVRYCCNKPIPSYIPIITNSNPNSQISLSKSKCKNMHMVQYAIIQHFDQKLQKTENFYLATIFKVKHPMSSDISIFFHRRIRVSENSSFSIYV